VTAPARPRRRARRVWHGYLFVVPLLVVMLAVVVYPVAYNARVSVFDYDAARNTWTFAGLDNYLNVLRSSVFWQSLRVTLAWVAANVGLQFVVGMAVAVALHRIRIGRGFLGGVFLVPWISSFVIVAILWMWVYHPQLGVLNDILLRVGLVERPIPWLSRPELAFAALVVANSWKFFPLVMITLLAGLQSIPSDFYEVAEIEGANRWQSFTQVTVPSMLPSISSAVVVAGIWAFNAFTLPFIMTGGGPLRATEVLGLYIYKQAFTSFDFGAAAAAAIFLFLLILLFVVAYLRLVRDDAS
jgi:multiple sugar transport system permease protein